MTAQIPGISRQSYLGAGRRARSYAASGQVDQLSGELTHPATPGGTPARDAMPGDPAGDPTARRRSAVHPGLRPRGPESEVLPPLCAIPKALRFLPLGEDPIRVAPRRLPADHGDGAGAGGRLDPGRTKRRRAARLPDA